MRLTTYMGHCLVESLGIGVVWRPWHEGRGWHQALHGRVADELSGGIERHIGVDVDGVERFLWMRLALIQVVIVMQTFAWVQVEFDQWFSSEEAFDFLVEEVFCQ